jgi:hypothetical protein
MIEYDSPQLLNLQNIIRPLSCTATLTTVDSEQLISVTSSPSMLETWETHFLSFYDYVAVILFTVGFVPKEQIQTDPCTVVVNLGSVFDILMAEHGISS